MYLVDAKQAPEAASGSRDPDATCSEGGKRPEEAEAFNDVCAEGEILVSGLLLEPPEAELFIN